MSLIPLLSSLALSGYGDPTDGVPSYIEREIHLWTNAVRVDPEYFRDDYVDGGCTFDSFNVVEQTPQVPYWWHGGLGEVARRHSVDMRTNDHFSHSSSDGTSMGNRLAPFYPTGAVGENIAQGYPSAFSVVVQGWMCSTSGHRAAIMSPSFEDLGVGVDADWYTQNFGERGYDPHAFSARLGLHFPERPSSEVTFRLAVHTGDAPPAAVSVVYNGVRHSMGLLIGEPSNGIYEVTVPDDAHGCGAYWFSLDEGGAGIAHPRRSRLGHQRQRLAPAEALEDRLHPGRRAVLEPGDRGLADLVPLEQLLRRARVLADNRRNLP